MPEMREVYSSSVAEIGYDADTETLIVLWQKGRKSSYAGVPSEIAEQVMNAPSIGAALRDSIIPSYIHRYI